MSVNIKKSSALNKLNLTPMIDVVFQLLIFFLVATRFEEEQERTMDIQVPQADEAMARIAKPKELFVNIDQAGKVFVNGRQVTHDALLTQLRQAQTNNPGRQSVIVRGDKRCPWEHIMAVRNLCAKANIRDAMFTATAPGS
jgi:biopolymer transport protein ExbD